MKQQKISIHRTRIGTDIIADFTVPPTAILRKKGRVAVIAKGVPSMPSGSEFLSFLASQGFYAILPRYRGTWESGGQFLKNEPTKDIHEVVDALSEPLLSIYEQKTYEFPKKPHLYLMVGSFGGPSGFFLSTDPRITAVFAYSPVVDWREKMEKEPLERFVAETKLAYGEAYRFTKGGVEKLMTGTFYNPATARERVMGDKIYIFHAKDDAIVAHDPVAQFAAKIGAHMTSYPKGGHGGASSLMEPRTWKRMMQIIERGV